MTETETDNAQDERTDASGRVLYPWEVDPADQVVSVQVEERDSGQQEQAEPQVDEPQADEPQAAAEEDEPQADAEEPAGGDATT